MSRHVASSRQTPLYNLAILLNGLERLGFTDTSVAARRLARTTEFLNGFERLGFTDTAEQRSKDQQERANFWRIKLMTVAPTVRGVYEKEWLGHLVQITYIDKYGFLGREAHPDPEDLGKFGIVTEVLDSSDDWSNDNFDAYAVFRVELNDGTVKELCDHELKRDPLS